MNEKSPFGLLAFLHWNHEWNRFHFPEEILPRAIEQIRDLGVGWLRLDILWADVQKPNGEFDFSHYEKIMRLVRSHGIHILGILHYNNVHQNESSIGKKWNDPPEDLDAFARYVRQTVSHFQKEIHAWEIWNEPNLDVYWSAPKDDLGLYAQLLKKSYRAAKEANPNALVLHGGLTEPIVKDVENLYKQAGKDAFDRINLHTFVDPKAPESVHRFLNIIEDVQTIMKKFGDEDKKIWITEMGCPGCPEEKKEMGWFGGGPVTENEQAEWIKIQFALLKKAPIVEKMFWAFYRDTDGEFKDATDYLGLVRGDLSEKPAFKAYKELIRNWKG